MTQARLDQAIESITRRGPRAVFVGLNIPGARAAVTPSAALASMPYMTFTPAMLAGSSVYYGWHIALGYALGPTAEMLSGAITHRFYWSWWGWPCWGYWSGSSSVVGTERALLTSS